MTIQARCLVRVITLASGGVDAGGVKAAALIAIASLVLAAGAAAAVDGGGTSPGGVLKEEVFFLNHSDWKPYYALMSPRFRAACSYSTFVARGRDVRKRFSNVSVKILSTRIAGSKAYLTYETKASPVPPFVTPNDVFVKLGGRWYDEVDPVTSC